MYFGTIQLRYLQDWGKRGCSLQCRVMPLKLKLAMKGRIKLLKTKLTGLLQKWKMSSSSNAKNTAWWTSHVLAMLGRFSKSSIVLYIDLCQITLKACVSVACMATLADVIHHFASGLQLDGPYLLLALRLDSERFEAWCCERSVSSYVPSYHWGDAHLTCRHKI